MNTGMAGEGGGVYHSIYDSFYCYTKFSDATFEYGRGLSQFNGTLVMRLAGADVLPFEFANLSDTVNQYLSEIDKLAKTGGGPGEISLAPLTSAAKSLSDSARRYEEALSKAAANGFRQVKQPKALNELLYLSERRLTNGEGLPRRPWFKHQLYAPGFYTGYGVKTIPGVREAIEEKKWNEVEPQMKVAAAALQALASQIESATRMLEGK
jgi:N-acetylated-alpha-linked acidic dipeptidase